MRLNTALSLSLPLFCVEYAEPLDSAEGNGYFLQQGAIGLKRSADDKPNLTRLLAMVRDRIAQQPSRPGPQTQFAF